MNAWKKLCLIFAVMSVFAAAAFVWPTMYYADRLKSGDSETPVLVNRFTHSMYVATGSGWTRHGFPRVIRPDEWHFGESVFKKIVGSVKIQTGDSENQTMSVQLYNGSEYLIQDVTIVIGHNGHRFTYRLNGPPIIAGSHGTLSATLYHEHHFDDDRLSKSRELEFKNLTDAYGSPYFAWNFKSVLVTK